jgi:hypothetical protein
MIILCKRVGLYWHLKYFKWTEIKTMTTLQWITQRNCVIDAHQHNTISNNQNWNSTTNQIQLFTIKPLENNSDIINFTRTTKAYRHWNGVFIVQHLHEVLAFSFAWRRTTIQEQHVVTSKRSHTATPPFSFLWRLWR